MCNEYKLKYGLLGQPMGCWFCEFHRWYGRDKHPKVKLLAGILGEGAGKLVCKRCFDNNNHKNKYITSGWPPRNNSLQHQREEKLNSDLRDQDRYHLNSIGIY